MQLTPEDSLRLNVLVANAEAIRIDENSLCVYGLCGEGEMKVPLNPNCRPEQYLQRVRELLSGVVLGSPGGYPVFLRRWTRMGQVDNDQLDKLLKIGEPEAVIAVSCAPSLSDELARRAWWAAPEAENARRMLRNPNVAGGRMGPVLAEFLIEYLPFESEHRHAIDSVRLVLQPGLIADATRRRLWEAGRNRRSYRVGFLAQPRGLPDPLPARAAPAPLAGLAAAGNPLAVRLAELLDGQGQRYLEEAAEVLRRPADQEVYSAILEALQGYFGPLRRSREEIRDPARLAAVAAELMAQPDPELADLLARLPELTREIEALITLAHVDEALVIPIFAHTDAVGSVMRKKVEPVSRVLLAALGALAGR